MAKKPTYVSHRTTRVGYGDRTVDLVAGEEIPSDLPQEMVDVLVENQQVYDPSADPGSDVYSQEYRNAKQAKEDDG